MLKLSTAQRIGVLLALIAMMASTRMSHFGTSSLLPDASLAVFLLGGLMLGRTCGFTVLMLAAFGIDVYSAQTATEVGWCFTPAYVGLIPTYGALWLAGIVLAQRQRFTKPLIAFPVSILAVGLAFIISNAFWFGMSGQFTGMGAMEFSLRVARYFTPYLGSAMLYLTPALVSAAFWQKSRTVNG
jgi:hypothetical protein